MFTMAGCFDQLIAPGTETDGRVTIDSDEAALAARLQYMDQVVVIDTDVLFAFESGQPAMVDGPARAPRAVDLTLVAELEPPTVDGITLQASAVSRRKNKEFLVSYNVRGDRFVGGIDYIQGGDSRFPRVKASVRFSDSDVSAVALSGKALYAAQGTNTADFDSPAAIEMLRLSGSRITLTRRGRRDLSSFAATSVQEIEGDIYVTTGDEGHLYALDEDDLTVLGQFPLDDARWVQQDDDDDDRIVVVQGTPGRISVFEEGEFPGGSMVLLNTFPFPGATVPESKSAMDIAGGKAFIAAGPEGVQIMCLDTGEIVGNVPRPDPEALGLDPSVVVTNAVTVDNDLMFISNGEAGVYVAAGADDWDDTDCDEPQSINVLGQLRFDDLQSVNHVDYRKGYLVVAAGLGGVKIVEVDITK